ncbi:MAG: cohesin domain-containing protein, partial [Bacteroidota bacterium]
MRLTLCLALLLSSMTTFAQSKPIINFQAEIQAGQPGDTVCIPVTTSNFIDVQGLGFGIRWDTSTLEYVSVDVNQALPNLTESDLGRTNVDNGDLKVSWITSTFPDGQTLDDDAVLFQVCFVIKTSANAGFYYVGFDSDFITPEVIVDDRLFSDPLGIPNFTPGGIIVEEVGSTLSINPEINFNLACGSFEASINPNINGGVAPYDYAWRGEGVFFSNAATLTNFPNEGLYTLEVTDQEGNTITGSFWVDFMGNEDGLPFPEFQVIQTQPTCDSASGSISLIPSEGNVDDFFYTWVGEDSNIAEGLAAGDYSVTINSKTNDCFDAFTIQLRPSDAVQEFTAFDTIPCIGDAIVIGQSNEEKPENASFLWSDGSTTSTITVSEPGSYTVTVTEDFCSEVTTFQVVRANEGLIASDFQLIQSDLACGSDAVEIGVIYQGSISGLSYAWTEGPTDSVQTISAPGIYFLTIVDEQGCSLEFAFNIEQETGDFSFNKVIAYQGCNLGTTLLSIEITDDKVYDFTWNTAETTSSISVMQEGTYSVTISETASGCTQVVLFDAEEIGDPTTGSIAVNLDCIIEGNCYLGTRYTIQVSGYEAPINYLWSDGTAMV